MKRLYLIRHAKSSWKDKSLDDFDRPLNKRGKRDAPVMGKQLKQQQVMPDVIISSPARRALKTAKIIAREIDFPEKQIITDHSVYMADEQQLLTVIQNIDDSFQTAMLFGHNPGFTLFANTLSDYQIDNIPTCGVFCVDFEVASWKEVAAQRGAFQFFDYPRKHQ